MTTCVAMLLLVDVDTHATSDIAWPVHCLGASNTVNDRRSRLSSPWRRWETLRVRILWYICST